MMREPLRIFCLLSTNHGCWLLVVVSIYLGTIIISPLTRSSPSYYSKYISPVVVSFPHPPLPTHHHYHQQHPPRQEFIVSSPSSARGLVPASSAAAETTAGGRRRPNGVVSLSSSVGVRGGQQWWGWTWTRRRWGMKALQFQQQHHQQQEEQQEIGILSTRTIVRGSTPWIAARRSLFHSAERSPAARRTRSTSTTVLRSSNYNNYFDNNDNNNDPTGARPPPPPVGDDVVYNYDNNGMPIWGDNRDSRGVALPNNQEGGNNNNSNYYNRLEQDNNINNNEQKREDDDHEDEVDDNGNVVFAEEDRVLFQVLLRDLQIEGVPLLSVDSNKVHTLQAALWTTMAELSASLSSSSSGSSTSTTGPGGTFSSSSLLDTSNSEIDNNNKVCLIMEDMPMNVLRTIVQDFKMLKQRMNIMHFLPDLQLFHLSLVGKGIGPAIIVEIIPRSTNRSSRGPSTTISTSVNSNRSYNERQRTVPEREERGQRRYQQQLPSPMRPQQQQPPPQEDGRRQRPFDDFRSSPSFIPSGSSGISSNTFFPPIRNDKIQWDSYDNNRKNPYSNYNDNYNNYNSNNNRYNEKDNYNSNRNKNNYKNNNYNNYYNYNDQNYYNAIDNNDVFNEEYSKRAIAAVKMFMNRLVISDQLCPYTSTMDIAPHGLEHKGISPGPIAYRVCHFADICHIISAFWNTICEMMLSPTGTMMLLLPKVSYMDHARFMAITHLISRTLCLFQGDNVFTLLHFHPFYDRNFIDPIDEVVHGHLPPLSWIRPMLQQNGHMDMANTFTEDDILLSNYQRRSPVTMVCIKRTSMVQAGITPQGGIMNLNLGNGTIVQASGIPTYTANAIQLAYKGIYALQADLEYEINLVTNNNRY